MTNRDNVILEHKELFIEFEKLEEFVDPGYNDEIVIESDGDDDGDDYVAENAVGVFENNDQTLTVNADNKRCSDIDARFRENPTHLFEEEYVFNQKK